MSAKLLYAGLSSLMKHLMVDSYVLYLYGIVV